MPLFWKKKEEKKERQWNLDFLTPQEKSAINMAFEYAEQLSKNGPESAREGIRTAKKHYLADMGYGDANEGYTKEDIAIIVLWTGATQKMMAELNLPEYREHLKLLKQVNQRFVENGLVGDLAGVPIPSANKDMSFLLPAEKDIVQKALTTVIKTEYYNEAKLNICRQALAHLMAGEKCSPDEVRFMGWSLEVFIGIVDERASQLSGAERGTYETAGNRAKSALKKIRD